MKMADEEKLDVKIGTKTEALWTKVKKSAENAIEQLEEEKEIQLEILKSADRIIAEEKKD